MKIRILFLAAFLLFGLAASLNAQSAELEKDTSWTTGGSIGLDLAQLALINPKIGAGENKLAFGGLNTLFAKYKKDKIAWESDASLQLGVQRLGVSENPFTKNIDLFRVNSKVGYIFSDKFNGAVLVALESLLLPTYDDFALSSTGDNSLQAKFFSPANIIVAPGLDYVHDKHLSVFVAPIAYKSVVVLDDDIASLGVHGNPWTSSTEFKNIKHEMGANLKAKYSNLYYEKLSVGSELNLFYNYLAEEHGAEFVDVIWINELGYELFKGFSLNMLLDFRWDRDVASVLGEGLVRDGLTEFRKWMITEAFVIKYNYVIK